MTQEPNEPKAAPTPTTEPPLDEGADAPVDERLAAALRHRFGATRRRVGPEPEALEEVAQLIDGTLPIMRRARVEARLDADPELAEVVRTLREMEGVRLDEPLVMPPSHAQRVGAAAVSASEQYARLVSERDNVVPLSAATRGIRPLARPETPARDSGRSRRFVAVGLGTALAMAAVMFLVTRPSGDKPVESAQGAGLAGAPEAVALRFQGADVVVDVRTQTPGRVVAALLDETGAKTVGELEIGARKNTLLVAVPKGSGCRYILAMSMDDGGAPKALEGARKALVENTCTLIPLDALRAATGARQLGVIRLP